MSKAHDPNVALAAPLPCPFCGKADTLKLTTAQELAEEGEDDPEPWMHSDSWAVMCDASKPGGPGGCGASGGFFASAAEAVQKWNTRAALAQRAEPVMWQRRFIDPDEGPGVWQSCDDDTRRLLQGRSDYELRPLYAAPQAQHVSGAADPVGSPAGEQTGPVSAAPTYTPQDAQPAPLSDDDIRAQLEAERDALRADARLLDWIECCAMNGQIQIARSTLRTGYEIAVLDRVGPIGVAVEKGTLREALAARTGSKP